MTGQPFGGDGPRPPHRPAGHVDRRGDLGNRAAHRPDTWLAAPGNAAIAIAESGRTPGPQTGVSDATGAGAVELPVPANGPHSTASRRPLRFLPARWLAALPRLPEWMGRFLVTEGHIAAATAVSWVVLPWVNPNISDTVRWLLVLGALLAGNFFYALATVLMLRAGYEVASLWLGRAERILPVLGIVLVLLAWSGGCDLVTSKPPLTPVLTRATTVPAPVRQALPV